MKSSQQMEYLKALAVMEAIDACDSELEQDYMRRHGLSNSDGTLPKFLWMLDERQDIEEHIKACCAEVEAIGFYEEKHKAEDALRQAEEALLEWGLRLVPADTRQTLEKACRTRCTTRHQVLDLIMQLDAATVH